MDRLIAFVDSLPRVVGATLCGLPVALGVIGAFTFPVMFAYGMIWEGVVCLIGGILAIYFLVYSRLLSSGYFDRKRKEQSKRYLSGSTHAQNQQSIIGSSFEELAINPDLKEMILNDYYFGLSSRDIAEKLNLKRADVQRIIAAHEAEIRTRKESEEESK